MQDEMTFNGRHYTPNKYAGKRWHYDKVCHYCGEEYQSTYATSKYCSGACRMAACRERRKVDTRCYCQWCGRAFLAKRGDAKYDSRACQQKAYRARKGAGKQGMF